MPEFIHSGEEKKAYVQKMFDDVAPRYDFLNHLLSFGIDIYWRKKLIKYMNVQNEQYVLDVATGTGDVLFELKKRFSIKAVGLDYAFNMVKIASQKAESLDSKPLFVQGDGESLPFEANNFDRISISFGFRNIGHYEKALSEFNRVLKPGGLLAILEFSEPPSTLINSLYQFYFHKILPKIGALLSRADAYRYLPESVHYFPPREEICQLMINAGFKRAEVYDLTFGISSVFLGYKD